MSIYSTESDSVHGQCQSTREYQHSGLSTCCSDELSAEHRFVPVATVKCDLASQDSRHLATEPEYNLLLPAQTAAHIALQTPVARAPLDICRLVHCHYRTFRLSGPLKNPRWTWKRALVEVLAVRKSFPAVGNNRGALLAMTAWFHVLCNIDDEIERLDGQRTRAILAYSISMLRDASPDREEHIHDTATPVHAAAKINVCTNEPQDAGYARIIALSQNLIRQCKSYLPNHALFRVLFDIIEVLEALGMESEFRDSLVAPSTAEYLSLRVRTIGTSPFFTILETSLLDHDRKEFQDLDQREPYNVIDERPQEYDLNNIDTSAFWPSQHHVQFRDCVNRIIGRQNDIVGLPKDLENQESMNLIVLLAEHGSDFVRDVERIQTARSIAAAMHNTVMQDAVTLWASAKTSHRSHAVAVYVDSLLAFTLTHFKWAKHTNRYRPRRRIFSVFLDIAMGATERTAEVMTKFKMARHKTMVT